MKINFHDVKIVFRLVAEAFLTGPERVFLAAGEKTESAASTFVPAALKGDECFILLLHQSGIIDKNVLRL